MRRVYGIWFFRAVFPWVAAEVALFTVFLVQIKESVWVGQVVGNFLAYSAAHPMGFLEFSITAFFLTETAVKAAFVGTLLAAMLLLREMLQSSKKVVLAGRFFSIR